MISALTAGRLLAGGRVLIGAALIAVPEQSTRQWLGEVSSSDGTKVAVRSLGARDLLLGVITLHTLSEPAKGARWVRACALADMADAGATYAGRRSLPRNGAWGTIALAGVAAIKGLHTAHRLARTPAAA